MADLDMYVYVYAYFFIGVYTHTHTHVSNIEGTYTDVSNSERVRKTCSVGRVAAHKRFGGKRVTAPAVRGDLKCGIACHGPGGSNWIKCVVCPVYSSNLIPWPRLHAIRCGNWRERPITLFVTLYATPCDRIEHGWARPRLIQVVPGLSHR